MIAMPGGKIASNQIVRHAPIKMGTKIFKIDLIILGLEKCGHHLEDCLDDTSPGSARCHSPST
jgi:hypothetical protein